MNMALVSKAHVTPDTRIDRHGVAREVWVVTLGGTRFEAVLPACPCELPVCLAGQGHAEGIKSAASGCRGRRANPATHCHARFGALSGFHREHAEVFASRVESANARPYRSTPVGTDLHPIKSGRAGWDESWPCDCADCRSSSLTALGATR